MEQILQGRKNYVEEVPRVQIVDMRRRNEELQRRIDEAQGGDGRYRLLVRILLGGLATLAGVPSDLTLVTASVLSCWFVQEQLPTIRMFVRSDVIRRCASIYIRNTTITHHPPSNKGVSSNESVGRHSQPIAQGSKSCYGDQLSLWTVYIYIFL
jgi:hypothetical protein